MPMRPQPPGLSRVPVETKPDQDTGKTAPADAYEIYFTPEGKTAKDRERIGTTQRSGRAKWVAVPLQGEQSAPFSRHNDAMTWLAERHAAGQPSAEGGTSYEAEGVTEVPDPEVPEPAQEVSEPDSESVPPAAPDEFGDPFALD